MNIIYGINNCDTVKKARHFLDQNNITYQFHNYKKDGITPELLDDFMKLIDWKVLLNQKGTTWRKLNEQIRANVNSEEAAKKIMLENPSIIKRPLLIKDNNVALIGFSVQSYQDFFKLL